MRSARVFGPGRETSAGRRAEPSVPARKRRAGTTSNAGRARPRTPCGQGTCRCRDAGGGIAPRGRSGGKGPEGRLASSKDPNGCPAGASASRDNRRSGRAFGFTRDAQRGRPLRWAAPGSRTGGSPRESAADGERRGFGPAATRKPEGRGGFGRLPAGFETSATGRARARPQATRPAGCRATAPAAGLGQWGLAATPAPITFVRAFPRTTLIQRRNVP